MPNMPPPTQPALIRIKCLVTHLPDDRHGGLFATELLLPLAAPILEILGWGKEDLRFGGLELTRHRSLSSLCLRQS